MARFIAMSAFVRVVEAGSFTKAAETIDLPKPTVTRLVQGLERDLRVLLLDRTTRSVTVTAEGAAYYERVVRLLAELSDIESTTKQTLAKPSGRLHVDVATAIATDVLIPALPDFYRAYPDIELGQAEFADAPGHQRLLVDEARAYHAIDVLRDQVGLATNDAEFDLRVAEVPIRLRRCMHSDRRAARYQRGRLLRQGNAGNSGPVALEGFAFEDVLRKMAPFLEQLRLHPTLAAGTTGVQGVATEIPAEHGS